MGCRARTAGVQAPHRPVPALCPCPQGCPLGSSGCCCQQREAKSHHCGSSGGLCRVGDAFPLQFGGFFLTPTRGLKARLVNETHPGVPLRPGRMEGLLCHHSPGSDVSWHGSALCPDYGEGRCEALDGSSATALPPSPGHVFPPPRALHWHSWLLRGAELNKNTPAPFPLAPKRSGFCLCPAVCAG